MLDKSDIQRMPDFLDIFDETTIAGIEVFDRILGKTVVIRKKLENGTFQIINRETGTTHIREIWDIA